MQRAAQVVFLLLSIVIGLGFGLRRLDAGEPLRLRVLSYNIHHGRGSDGKVDLERIAQVIRGAKPDIVALQEVKTDIRGLARFFDYPAMPESGEPDPPGDPPVDMGAYELFDCNNNGIPDPCDVDCGPPGDHCNIEGCGQSEDCNGNSVPDECEADCNQNEIPDDCDIINMTSDDCNGNDLPDECEIDENSPAPGGPFYNEMTTLANGPPR